MTCAGGTIGPFGTRFDDFLAEHGILEETQKQAANSVLAWQLPQVSEEASTTEHELARHLTTGFDGERPSDE